MKVLSFTILVGAAVVAGCGVGGAQNPDAAGGGGPLTCAVTAPTSCPTPAPRYMDVQPIIQQNCASPCHSGTDPAGPWPLTSYEHVADWADIVSADLLDCTMPPADGGVSLSAEDRQAILTWIRCGFPQ
jgi:hypothetical protein